MDILSIIERKKKREALSAEEIRFFVRGAADGTLPDYQAAALLMAIRLNGMTDEETFALTAAMVASGVTMDLGALPNTVDKHSTGGVSDATTFVVVPLLACLGFTVAKLSGRGLGFTGGTIDKLECFDGYRADLSTAEFLRIAAKTGASIASATSELAPADKRLYALRDVTGTVDSLPLIASSVMSKKLAAGAETIVLDVKYGDGAFMKTPEDAVRLAALMVRIGRDAGRKTGALVTSMNQPLGEYVGGNLECRGAIEVLKGKRNDLYEVSRRIVMRACELNERPVSNQDIDRLIDDGTAYRKFEEIVAAHGGRISAREPAAVRTEILARASGYVGFVRTQAIGEVNLRIGGGRTALGGEIDHAVGIELCARLGDRVEPETTLAVLYTNRPDDEAAQALRDCFSVTESPVTVPPVILNVL